MTMKNLWGAAFLMAFTAAPGAVAQSAAPGSNSSQVSVPSQKPLTDASHADAYYYFTMGHMLEQQFEMSSSGDLATQAIDSYKKALAIEPDSATILERLAEIYAKSQHIRDAVIQAQAALKLDPDNVDAHRLLARNYVRTLGDMSAGEVQQENLAKATEQFQAILKSEPNDIYSLLWLARLYRFQNQHGEAEKVLRRALAHSPDNGPALEQLSLRAVRAGAQIDVQTEPKGRFDAVLLDAPCTGTDGFYAAVLIHTPAAVGRLDNKEG